MIIIAFTDIHGNRRFLDTHRKKIQFADWVLLLGDITHGGHQADAATIIEPLRRLKPAILAVPGNMDHADVTEYLLSEGISLHERWRRDGDVGFAGMGGSNITPFRTPNEYSEEALTEGLALPLAAIRECPFRLMLTHVPPVMTLMGTTRSGRSAGSSAIRSMVEQEAPTIHLCGHVHESAGIDRVGTTLIANPGPAGEGGFIQIEVMPRAWKLSLMRNDTELLKETGAFMS